MTDTPQPTTIATIDPQDYDLPKPLVVTLGNLKGGVGKTTSAFFLAMFFAEVLKLRVVYLDADPLSQTGYAWHRRLVKADAKVPFTMVPYPAPRLGDYIEEHHDEFDVFILDIGGETDMIFKAAVPETDELILVTSVSPSEARRIPSSFRAASAAIAEKQEDDPDWERAIRVRVLMTKVPVTMKNGINVSSEYRTTRDELEGAGYEVFATYMRAWKWYREAADGRVGDGAENPLIDIAEYRDLGLEIIEPYRVEAEKVSA